MADGQVEGMNGYDANVHLQRRITIYTAPFMTIEIVLNREQLQLSHHTKVGTVSPTATNPSSNKIVFQSRKVSALRKAPTPEGERNGSELWSLSQNGQNPGHHRTCHLIAIIISNFCRAGVSCARHNRWHTKTKS